MIRKLQPTNHYRPPIGYIYPTRCGGQREFASHRNRHLDELLGQWGIMKWAPRDWYDRHCVDDRIVIGIGHGAFDEHGGWVKQNGCWVHIPSKFGESCASLVFKTIESEGRTLYDYDVMRVMLQFVKDNDLTADRRSDEFRRDIAHVINYLHRLFPEEAVIDWALQALDVWYASRELDPTRFTVDHLREQAVEGAEGRVPREARKRWKYSMYDWMDMAIAALEKQEKDFQTACHFVRNISAENTFETKRYDGERVRVLFVQSSNWQVGPASRWEGYDLCLQYHPPKSGPLAGGIQIFRNFKRQAGAIDLRPIAFQFKRLVAERYGALLPDQSVFEMNRDQWLLPGYAHPWDPVYFFVADPTMEQKQVPPGEAVFLKSLTAPDIPVEGLVEPDEAVAIVCKCLERYREDPYLPIVRA